MRKNLPWRRTLLRYARILARVITQNVLKIDRTGGSFLETGGIIGHAIETGGILGHVIKTD